MKILSVFLFVLLGLNTFAQNEDIIDGLSANEFNGKVLLTWSIKQGNTCNGVLILRSTDSVNFTQIGSIEGICGSTANEIFYDFTDISPEKNAINYYRLSLGGIGFSRIVSAEVIDMGANNSLLRPNPLNEASELFFDNETNSVMTLNIYSNDGILIRSQDTTSEKFILSKSDYAAGMYYYVIFANETKPEIIGKFVVE